MTSVWDAVSKPGNGQYSFRLIKNMPFGNWSWFKDSENRVGISLEMQKLTINTEFKPNKYFVVSILPVEGMGNVLNVVCQDLEFYTIFEVLCRDLVEASGLAKSLQEAVALLKSRLVLWAELFKGLKGVTRQEIYGLAAELSFLRIWLENQSNKNLDIWVGPNGKSQDFISITGANAVEIKASSNDLSIVRIASLEQLDFAGDLILAVFPISSAKENSVDPINLQTLADSIEGILPSNQIDSFRRKLAMLGVIFNEDVNVIRFTIGEPQYFDVRTGFPRIIKTTISSEIFNCSYDISLGSLSEFATNQTNAISRLSK
jgi:hypothetical protein